MLLSKYLTITFFAHESDRIKSCRYILQEVFPRLLKVKLNYTGLWFHLNLLIIAWFIRNVSCLVKVKLAVIIVI